MEPKPLVAAARQPWPDHTRGTLRVEEVARLLGIGRSNAYAAIRRGEIPALKFGRSVRVSRAVVDRMLADVTSQ